jgi:hypothetical protein
MADIFGTRMRTEHFTLSSRTLARYSPGGRKGNSKCPLSPTVTEISLPSRYNTSSPALAKVRWTSSTKTMPSSRNGTTVAVIRTPCAPAGTRVPTDSHTHNRSIGGRTILLTIRRHASVLMCSRVGPAASSTFLRASSTAASDGSVRSLPLISSSHAAAAAANSAAPMFAETPLSS